MATVSSSTRRRHASWFFVLFLAALVHPASASTPTAGALPASAKSVELRNTRLAVSWHLDQGRPRMSSVHHFTTGQKLRATGELFSVSLADGRLWPASQWTSQGPVRRFQRAPQAQASQLAQHFRAQGLEWPIASPDGSVRAVWRAILLEDAHYVRQELEFTATTSDFPLREVQFFDESWPEGRTAGRVDGCPLVIGSFFAGIEDPHARNEGLRDRVLCRLPHPATLSVGESWRVSTVVGAARPGQLRRDFLRYVEMERAHPYRPFLHYNSWYDIAWSPFHLNETNCLEAIQLVGEHLIRQHGVVMDALVFDDGWDDPHSLWKFHAGFPRGFTPLAEACRSYGTRLGVWLSPFGGYGEPREQRLRFGHAQGYETNATGFSLAGPRYQAAFKQACVEMIRRYGVNHFKFDGIATGMYAQGGADYIRDTEAMRQLMLDLRHEDPNLYINLTTGSWPSPFWLRFADSLWRQGNDMGLAGSGSAQDQWITYRDQETYRNIAQRSPLYPLNALMTQGVAWSRHGTAANPGFNSAGFRRDVRGFFGSGTSLQELYIQPSRLSNDDWRVLAEGAKWARAHAATLADTHWVGGDPGHDEVYGYASWSRAEGILMLRNPSAQTKTFLVDPSEVFELPPHAARRWEFRSAWAEEASQPRWSARAGRPTAVALAPYDLRVWEARPR